MLLVGDSLHTNHSGPQQHARAFRGACFWHSSRVASPDEYTRGKWSAPQRSFRASQDAMCEKHDAQSPSAQATTPSARRSSAAEQSRRLPQAARAAAAVGTCVEIKILHIDATPAQWRGDAGSSPLDRARTAASSPRNDFVKNYRVHPTHRLISTQVGTSC